MPCSVEEDILRFEIAVGDALALVQEFEYQDDLSEIEARDMFGKAALAPQVGEDFAAGAVIQLGRKRVSDMWVLMWSEGHQLTSIYRHSESVKVVINVVIKGWPATSARMARSWLT